MAANDPARSPRTTQVALAALSLIALAGIGFLLADDRPGGKEGPMFPTWKGSPTATPPATGNLETATFSLG